MTCPACHAALREHASRLVCETCHGLLITEAELAATIEEQLRVEPMLELDVRAPGACACPICASAMMHVQLRINVQGLVVDPRVELDRCHAHGLWCDDGDLATIFAALHKPHWPLRGHCPICDDELAAVGSRLVCARDGMLVAADELTEMINDLEIVDDGKTLHACPRCHRAMGGVLLRVGDDERAGSRCARHGIWLGQGVLEAVLAASGASGSGGGTGGVRLHVAPSRSAFARSTEHHTIGKRKVPAKRAPRTPPAPSPFATRTLACPRCPGHALAYVGERWDCTHCEGSFVEVAALEAMVSEMTGGPWPLPPSTGIDGARACPICTAPLVLEVIEAIQIDRCPTHGVWFDPEELSTLLAASTHVDERPTGATAWLRRLFVEDP